MIFLDPLGPLRTINRSPTGGPTLVTLSCGHVREWVNHFSYRVGDDGRCFGCTQRAKGAREGQ